MSASWLWARADLRRRWRAVVVLTVLTGLAGGFAVTVAVGARRTATAWERFRTETRADDAFVSIPSRPEPEFVGELEAMPEVVAAAGFVYVAVTLPGVTEGGAFAATDDGLLRTVQRGRLVEGRRADPSRADEVVVNPVMASAARVRPGQRVRLRGAGDSVFSKEVTVVGVLLIANDLALNTGFPSLLLTPAFFRAHADDVDTGRVNQFVRLEGGGAAIPAFRDRLAERHGGQGGVLVGDSNEEASGLRNALRLQATALAILAAVAATAAVLAVGQALARHIGVTASDGPALHALGMTTGDRTWGALAPVVIVAVGGAALATAAAVAASPLVPTGLARQVESDTGLKVELAVLGGSGLVLAAVVAAAGYLAARRAAMRRNAVPALQVTHGLRVPLGPAATVGLATALGRGGARTRSSARSAIAASLAGVLGVTASATFAASLDHVLETPRLYGWNFDAVVGVGGDDPARIDDAIAGLVADPDVTRVAAQELVFLTLGDQAVETYVLHQQKGAPVLPTIAAGRAPQGPDEIVLGSTAMAELGVGLGDAVEAVGMDGPVALTVVGQGVFPTLGEGGTTNAAAIPTSAASALRLEESRGRLVMIGVSPGNDPVAVASRHTDLPVLPPEPPSAIQNLRLVGSTPWLLATFLAALAVAAMGHALAVSVRAGRRDLAVLRALGFVRRQVQAAVQWQAVAIVVLGVVAGVPLGIATGRWIWALAVRSTGALTEPLMPAGKLVVIVPLALLLAYLAGSALARIASRMRPAEVLRAE